MIETRDDAEIEVTIDMVNAALDAINAHDCEREEPESLAFAIAYRVLKLDRDRRIRRARL